LQSCEFEKWRAWAARGAPAGSAGSLRHFRGASRVLSSPGVQSSIRKFA
jgi:hypothetical protein